MLSSFAITAAFALVGGALMNWILSIQNVYARIPEIPKTINAQEFKVLDEKGNLRGSFGVTDKNLVALKICDEGGRVRGAFSLSNNDFLSLTFFDCSGKARGSFSLSKDDLICLNLKDAKDNAELVLAATSSGERPFMSISGKDKDQSACLMLEDNGGRLKLKGRPSPKDAEWSFDIQPYGAFSMKGSEFIWTSVGN